MIEARISPLDIDVVKIGLRAKIQLSAFKRRTTPTLEGKVIEVSGNVFEDEKTGQSYYVARVIIDEKDMKKMQQFTLYPGMPVEVMIVVNSHSLLTYLFSPLRDSFSRAFREQ